jgi:hypothetical protein
MPGLCDSQRWADRLMRPAALLSIIGRMDKCIHRIEDDLSPNWVERWAETGVQAIEDYLAKHLAFLSFLDDAA